NAGPGSQPVAIVLVEKNIAFEFRHIESDTRPDWFRAISPHNKVPVLRIDDRVSLFESGAIAEYLDETHAPRLHPEDPVARAINRAWIEYLPSAVDLISGHAYAKTEAEYDKAAALVPPAFEKPEGAMAAPSSMAPPFPCWMPPMRPSCGAISSWGASASSAISRDSRGSRPGPRRSPLAPRPTASRRRRSRRCIATW